VKTPAGVTLKIPPGALDEDLMVTIEKVPVEVSEELEPLGPVYEFGPKEATFSR
jgi:hypothetical protein